MKTSRKVSVDTNQALLNTFVAGESKGNKTTTITIKTKQQNGTVAHATPTPPETDIVKPEAKSGICAIVLRTILLTLLFALVFTAIVIALEEVNKMRFSQALYTKRFADTQ